MTPSEMTTTAISIMFKIRGPSIAEGTQLALWR